MLAEMQDAAVAADRHVKRRIVVEAMLPLDLEAEEADIELARLGNVEDAQDGRDGAKFRHGVATVQEVLAECRVGKPFHTFPGLLYFSSSSRSR